MTELKNKKEISNNLMRFASDFSAAGKRSLKDQLKTNDFPDQMTLGIVAGPDQFKDLAKNRLRYGQDYMRYELMDDSKPSVAEEEHIEYEHCILENFDKHLRPFLDNRLNVTLEKLRAKGYCTETALKQVAYPRSKEEVSAGYLAEIQATMYQGLAVHDLIPKDWQEGKDVTDEDWKRAIEEIAALRLPEMVGNDSIKSYARQIVPYISEIYARVVTRKCFDVLAAVAIDQSRKSVGAERDKLKEDQKQMEEQVKALQKEKEEFEQEKAVCAKRLAEAERETVRDKQKIRALERKVTELEKTAVSAEEKAKKSIPVATLSADSEKEYRRQIAALNVQILHRGRTIAKISGGSLLKSEPIDAYPGEQQEFLLSVLEQLRNRTNNETRAFELLDSLIKANKDQTVNTGKNMLEELKRILSESRQLTENELNRLRSLGFTCVNGGKHLKVAYLDKYTYTLAVSPSDYRTALQRYRDISRAAAVSVCI